jgi:hypothetical protein
MLQQAVAQTLLGSICGWVQPQLKGLHLTVSPML